MFYAVSMLKDHLEISFVFRSFVFSRDSFYAVIFSLLFLVLSLD